VHPRLWNTDKYVMAGRTMDWPESTEPTMSRSREGVNATEAG
jgi:penicillin V acylase-like amidase (Ntn superfamily)